MKKSYNPFKMWGSYVGAVASLFTPLPISTGMLGFVSTPIGIIKEVIRNPIYDNPMYNTHKVLGIIGLIILMGIGFLIGWGIHSLIRKLR